MRNFRLYVILDQEVCAQSGEIIKIAEKVITAGADAIQLRAKHSSEREILKVGRAIKKITRRSKALFLLNDRADLACALDADGLHLGQEDLPLKDARKILGKNKIVGLSTHSLKQARRAEKEAADYIAIGPIFATATKPKLAPLGPEIIGRLRNEIKIPFLAIGGIDLNNLEIVLSAGAERIAVCRAIIAANDVALATKQFKQQLQHVID